MRRALKLVMQNDGDFVDVTLIYINVQKPLCFSLFLITTGMLVSVDTNHKGILLHSVFNVFQPVYISLFKNSVLLFIAKYSRFAAICNVLWAVSIIEKYFPSNHWDFITR